MHDIVDLDRYPLDRPDSSACHALVARAQAELATGGMFNLPAFLTPAALANATAALAPAFARDAFTHARRHNIYFRKTIPDLPPDHPALAEVETINRTLCADQMAGNPVLALYDWPPFAAFLARVNAMSYAKGQGLNWHFDRSEFTTTLLLQAPRGGGLFEYRSDLRTAEDPNYDGVARLLRGDDPALRAITLAPGTLNVFLGRNTAHRVTQVEGETDRIIAVFSFYDRPGVRFTPEEQQGFYGRVG